MAGALSLGSCEHFQTAGSLTWANSRCATSSGWVVFTVIPRCSPLYLVRLWCRAAAPSVRLNCSLDVRGLPTRRYLREADQDVHVQVLLEQRLQVASVNELHPARSVSEVIACLAEP